MLLRDVYTSILYRILTGFHKRYDRSESKLLTLDELHIFRKKNLSRGLNWDGWYSVVFINKCKISIDHRLIDIST